MTPDELKEKSCEIRSEIRDHINKYECYDNCEYSRLSLYVIIEKIEYIEYLDFEFELEGKNAIIASQKDKIKTLSNKIKQYENKLDKIKSTIESEY